MSAWKLVWRDSEQFEHLSERDADVLSKVAGSNHHFTHVGPDGFSTSGACGHLNKGLEFHWLCRTCQYVTTGKLCCTGITNHCANGDVFEKKNPDIFEKVRRFRFNLVAGTRDKGYPLHMWASRKVNFM